MQLPLEHYFFNHIMPLLSALGDLIGAGQTPDANPYYGAQYLTPEDHPSIKQPVWVDANGQPINDPTFTSLHPQAQQALASMPWKNPGFWGSLGNIGKQEKMANMAAEEYGGQQAQQRQAESLAYQNALQNKIGGANTLIGQSPSVQRMLAAQGDLSGSGLQAWNTATAQENAGVPGAEAGAIKNVALRTQAQNPIGANRDISQEAITQADIANQRAGETQALLPGERELQQLGQGRAWWDTAHIPSIGPNQPVINPDMSIGLQRNYTGSLQNQLMSSVMGGGTIGSLGSGLTNSYGGGNTAGQGSGVQPIAAPSGTYYPPPAASQQSPVGNPNIIGQVPGNIGRPETMASRGTGDENQDNYLTAREKAAHDSALAKHKLIGAQVKASQAELEHQKQALIEARQQNTPTGIIHAIGNTADSVSNWLHNRLIDDPNFIFNNPRDPNWTGPSN